MSRGCESGGGVGCDGGGDGGGVGVGVNVGGSAGDGDGVGVGVGVDVGVGDAGGIGDVGDDRVGESCDGQKDGVGVGVPDLLVLRDKIKNAVAPEKVRGCVLLLRAWDICKEKKSYSSLKTFVAKSVRPVCNCLRFHHNGNVEEFVSYHSLTSIHNCYKKCKGNGNMCSN